jgi:GNAT superfamily N-acetyltransferase
VHSAYPPYVVRRAALSETGLIGDLRLSSLVSLEMPGDRLDSIRAFTAALPDVDADLVGAGRYFVADSGGELVGGIGWSVLPLGFRGDGLVSEDRNRAALSLAADSVLVRGFFVDPDVGPRAVGTNLLAHLELEAVRAGHGAFELVVPHSAQLIYRSLGFRPVARLALRTDDGVLPLMQMRKPLAVRLKSAA